MRLDHLLSKENRVFLFCHWVGCLVRRLAGDSFLSLFGVWFGREVVAEFLFSGGELLCALLCVWGISETRMSVFVFWFVLLFGMLLGV